MQCPYDSSWSGTIIAETHEQTNNVYTLKLCWGIVDSAPNCWQIFKHGQPNRGMIFKGFRKKELPSLPPFRYSVVSMLRVDILFDKNSCVPWFKFQGLNLPKRSTFVKESQLRTTESHFLFKAVFQASAVKYSLNKTGEWPLKWLWTISHTRCHQVSGLKPLQNASHALGLSTNSNYKSVKYIIYKFISKGYKMWNNLELTTNGRN